MKNWRRGQAYIYALHAHHRTIDIRDNPGHAVRVRGCLFEGLRIYFFDLKAELCGGCEDAVSFQRPTLPAARTAEPCHTGIKMHDRAF